MSTENNRIERLIAQSSLGTEGARRLRSRTSPEVRERILSASRESRPDTTTSPANHNEGGETMSKSSNRHVVPNGNGGWAVRAPGASRASSNHSTQSAAERAARRIVGNNGGGEVVIHRPNGQIRDSDTVAPGNDPNPPRDTK